jgi:hypothetical protein
MASNASERSGWLTAGGILSIVGGSFEAIGGGILVGLIVATVMRDWPEWGNGIMTPIVIPSWAFIAAGALLVLGVIAIVGGVSALRRKRFGLSLAGALCALPSVILGILAIVFMSLSKKEFEVEGSSGIGRWVMESMLGVGGHDEMRRKEDGI